MSISVCMRSVRSMPVSRETISASFSGIFAVSALNGCSHQVAPFGPATVIVTHFREAQQVLQHEPGMAAALTNTAISHNVVLRLQAGTGSINFLQLGRRL